MTSCAVSARSWWAAAARGGTAWCGPRGSARSAPPSPTAAPVYTTLSVPRYWTEVRWWFHQVF
ncbi:hypothetical protein JYU34_022614 [Plutella xylostella]|uniref:Secreted protein n=1 Tax=Plutella xylostella TaxID=51655 RepID=A0ABQ7PPT1_PLUXY|nr:hypothetical protein JYU34_022614 [Plutella xylostella]